MDTLPVFYRMGLVILLLFAFKLPTQSKKSSANCNDSIVYEKENLPLNKARFRVFNSTAMTMVFYNSYDACVEATME